MEKTLCLIVLVCLSTATSSSSRFDEHLTLTPAGNGDVVAQFAFTVATPDTHDLRHFDLFPRPMGELARAHGIEELEVTLGDREALEEE